MKPVVTAVTSEITACITILAALPYELGDVANILPPEWKKYVATIGAISTLILRIIKRYQEEKQKQLQP